MTIFLAIVLAGLGTYAMRAGFIVGLAGRRFPSLILRLLSYVGPAVMGGLIVSMLSTSDGNIQIGPPELAGLISAAAVAAATRNHIYTLLTGMSMLWLVGFLASP